MGLGCEPLILLYEATVSSLSRVLEATSTQFWPGGVSFLLKGHRFGHQDWQGIFVWGRCIPRPPLSSPKLRFLEQSPQLRCFILAAPGWAQINFIIYFQRHFLIYLLSLFA